MSTVSHGWSGPGSDVPEPDVRATLDLAGRSTALRDFHKLLAPEDSSSRAAGEPVPLARARKVSVSLPEQLTAAVQRRVGKGEFSHYVAEAVARQLELDLLAELSDMLADEHGPIPEEYLAQASAAWPDAE